mgnify:CR=1 FL=1
MKQRVIWGAIALLILLPFLLSGGYLPSFAGLLAYDWCGRNVAHETSRIFLQL